MLYEKTRYSAPYDYLINKEIQEYDISKANISILRQSNIINDQQYNYLYNLDKRDREVKVGLELRKNPELNKVLDQGFIQSRKLFFEANNIDDIRVLYIDKDSVTVIDQMIKVNKIAEYIDFKQKERYTSFYRLGVIDFLYYNDNEKESYRFKNANMKRLLTDHKNYMIDFLLSVAYLAQNNSSLDLILMIRDFYNKYVNKKLNVRYYREFNQTSMYKVLSTSTYSYYTDSIPNIYTDNIDIGYNAKLIRDLYKVFCNEYFRRAK